MSPSAHEQLEQAIANNPVIAWHLSTLVPLGRDYPQFPGAVFFTEFDIATLRSSAILDVGRPRPDHLATVNHQPDLWRRSPS